MLMGLYSLLWGQPRPKRCLYMSNGDSYVTGDLSKLNKFVEGFSKNLHVDIGILGGNGSTDQGGITLAGLGAVHELGTDKAGRNKDTEIPERSFIRMPLETGQDEIISQIEPKVKEYLEKGDTLGLMKLIGVAGEARIKEAFETGGFGKWEELKASTIKAKKGSTAILINEGTLRNAITSDVKEN